MVIDTTDEISYNFRRNPLASSAALNSEYATMGEVILSIHWHSILSHDL